MTTLNLFRGQRFLGGRGWANHLRLAVENALADDEREVVVLDFDGVEGVSHGFADELLTPLNELLGSDLGNRVRMTNVTPGVVEELQAVAHLHHLRIPSHDELVFRVG